MAEASESSAIVAAFGAAWAAHDLDKALSMTTDDCVFESTGPAPDGIQHKGHDEIRQAWQAIFDQLVFHANGDPVMHIPPEIRGWLGKLTPDIRDKMKNVIRRALIDNEFPG